MKRVSLKVVGGVHEGRLIPLPVGNFLVGREQDCQLRPQTDLVSRHHCVFKVDEFGARLRDLGSTNGTFVNGIRLSSPVTLNDSDKVVIGDLEFRVVAEAAIPAQAPEATEAAAALGQPDSVHTGAETILEVAKTGDTDVNMGGETITEMPALDPASMQTETFSNTDSAAIIPAQPAPETPAPQPVAPQPMPPQMPQYQQPPQQYNPYGQPAYPQQMGYPPQQMPYQQPMYPQMPQPYPQQMMPQQPYPQQPMPQQAAAPAAEPTPEAPAADDLDVSLPPPGETGAKEEAPKAKGSAGAGVNKDDPSSHAANIISSMNGRRPSKS